MIRPTLPYHYFGEGRLPQIYFDNISTSILHLLNPNFLKQKLYILTGLALILSSQFTASGATTEKTYTYVGDAPMVYFPTYRNETSDLAMKIDNPALAGKKITGVRAKVNTDGQTVTDCKIWLSTDLLLKKNDEGLKVNAPDIAVVDAPVDNDGWMTVKLDQPYTLDGSPVYVGYSFTVNAYNKEAKAPITYSQDRHEGGFYYYSYMAAVKWMDYQETLLGVLPIYVTIEGEFGDVELSPGEWDTANPYMQIDRSNSLPIRIWNVGNEAVSKFTYKYSGDDYSGEGEYVTEQPLQPNLTDYYVVYLPFDAMSKLGKDNIKIEITEANGKMNSSELTANTLPVECRRLVPVKRTVMEEATGTWCTACTRGIAAINELHRIYGDRFIAMAYHKNKDPMQTASDVPFDIPHFPSAVLDRGDVIDPYFGEDKSQSKHFMIEPLVRSVLDTPAVAAVDVKSEWADADKGAVNAEVTVEYAEPLNGKANSVAIAVVANGLKGEEPFWWQSNTYGKGTDTRNVPDMLKWLTEAGNPIMDMVYDHVVVYHYKNDNQAVDANIPTFTPSTFNFNIDLSKAVSTFESTIGLPLIQDKENIEIIALLLDENGRVLNANSAPIGLDSKEIQGNGSNAVESIAEDFGQVKSVDYFDLQGRKISNTSTGLVLKRTTYENGRSKTEKLIN